MSTAGKVLTVLSVLLMAVWIVLLSAVAQLNANATAALDKVKKEVVQLGQDVAQATQTAEANRVKTNTYQVARERALSDIRSNLSVAERQLTSTRETLSRVQFQLENYTKALASAKENLATRNQEKADLEKAKADTEALVNRVRGENAERLDQLTKLRTDFKKTFEANEAELAKLRGGPSSAPKPAGRPASFIR